MSPSAYRETKDGHMVTCGPARDEEYIFALWNWGRWHYRHLTPWRDCAELPDAPPELGDGWIGPVPENYGPR